MEITKLMISNYMRVHFSGWIFMCVCICMHVHGCAFACMCTDVHLHEWVCLCVTILSLCFTYDYFGYLEHGNNN